MKITETKSLGKMKTGKKLNWLQKLIIMLLYADDKKPVEGWRLKAMLFITINCWPWLRKSPHIRKFMKEVRFP